MHVSCKLDRRFEKRMWSACHRMKQAAVCHLSVQQGTRDGQMKGLNGEKEICGGKSRSTDFNDLLIITCGPRDVGCSQERVAPLLQALVREAGVLGIRSSDPEQPLAEQYLVLLQQQELSQH